MLRWTKWIAPVAGLVCVMAFNLGRSRADDTPTAPTAGKATVTVTVVDADGKPVPGATVGISVAPPKGGKKLVPTSQPAGATGAAGKGGRAAAIETGVTAADGTFPLPKLADGDFVVTARVKGGGNGRATVTIADGKDQTVSVTLKAAKKKAAAN